MTSNVAGARRRWGLRSRVQRLYGSRRQRLLIVPRAALERRYGSGRVAADDDDRWLRVEPTLGTVVEVGFAGKFRMFGALIDTQWTGRRGEVRPEAARYEYRFDRREFRASGGGDAGSARDLADETTRRLAGRSEIQRLTVRIDGEARQVEIVPLAGTITAVYFPPMPPYTVLMRDREADDHLQLLHHLLQG